MIYKNHTMIYKNHTMILRIIAYANEKSAQSLGFLKKSS